MRTLLLLLLVVLLPISLVSAAPARRGPHMPGELAKDRLKGMESLLLATDPVILAQPGHLGISLPTLQAKAVLACLSDLVLDDALYVEDTNYDWGSIGETLIIGEGLRSVTVSICRDKPYLTMMWLGGNRQVIANYLPVLPKVVRLLQAADPDDHTLSSYHPVPSPTLAAKGIPASALTRIATIKPRMTRADVLHVFTTEGGLSTSFWNHYVYREHDFSTIGQRGGLMAVNGQLIKVNIDFAPHDADILWLDGCGFWLHQSEYLNRFKPVAIDAGEHQDDIILRVSPPYLEYPSDN